LKKHKIIYTTFLLTAISCSNFRPYVLTDAFLDPVSSTEVVYNNLNWSYSLFNQYASGLSYTLRMNYSTFNATNVFNSVAINLDGVNYLFQAWDIVGSSFAEAELDQVWTNRINRVLFDRDFDRTTGKAITTNNIFLISFGGTNNVNLEIIIKSKITYKVNVGSLFMNLGAVKNANMDNTFIYIDFLDSQNQLLQSILLLSGNNPLAPNFSNLNFDLGTIVTNVSQFNLKFQWVDTPPFVTAGNTSVIVFSEFNLFTQQQEIAIPDDASGDVFGFEFVAVEWWNILGHLQNFAWWIVNKSPISPLFVWIDEYVVTWISGLITFLTGVFDL
jgi:hypothetical protein